jgi:hypothetical protein
MRLTYVQDGEHYIFKGPIREAKANEFVLVYDPESNCFVLERLTSMLRLSATRSSRRKIVNGNATTPNLSAHTGDRDVATNSHRSKSNDDIPVIPLDNGPSPNALEEEVLFSEPEEPIAPPLQTPRLPPASPIQLRRPKDIEPESSDDDSDMDINIAKAHQQRETGKVDADDDASDEDLDDLANELESSLENHLNSSSSDADSDVVASSKPQPPDLGNVPRSGRPISMSRFAGGRRRVEDESSSSSDDDD